MQTMTSNPSMQNRAMMFAAALAMTLAMLIVQSPALGAEPAQPDPLTTSVDTGEPLAESIQPASSLDAPCSPTHHTCFVDGTCDTPNDAENPAVAYLDPDGGGQHEHGAPNDVDDPMDGNLAAVTCATSTGEDCSAATNHNQAAIDQEHSTATQNPLLIVRNAATCNPRSWNCAVASTTHLDPGMNGAFDHGMQRQMTDGGHHAALSPTGDQNRFTEDAALTDGGSYAVQV